MALRRAAIAILASWARVASAQAAGVSVAHQGTDHLTIASGTLATLVFRVANGTPAARALPGTLVLPPGWQLVIPESPSIVPARGTELRLLRIALPADAAAGSYWVRYAIQSTTVADSLLAIVPERRAVTVHVREAPEFVTAGERYDVLFAVRNDGNSPSSLRLGLSGSDGSPVHMDSGAIRLDAGVTRLVRVHVESDAKLSHAIANRVRLSPSFDGDTTRIEPAVGVIRVLPRHPARAARFRDVPAQLTVRQVDRAAHPVVELRGEGALTTSGATTAEFVLRGLDQSTSLYGEQDEYHLSITSPRYHLRLGDRAAPYSPLGVSWRPGFGGEGELFLGPISVGGFAQRDRRTTGSVHSTEEGVHLGARPWQRLLGEVGYISRGGVNAGEVLTTHARLTAWQALALDAELGRGRDSAGTSGDAYTAAVSGSFPRAAYAVRRLVADSGFPGLTRGTTSSEASVTLTPMSRLGVSVSATDWSGRRQRIALVETSAWQRSLDSRITWAQWFEAGFRQTAESRIFSGSTHRRTIRAARLYATLPLGAGSLRGGIEQGITTPDDGSGHTPFRRLSVRGSVGRGRNQLAASVEWLDGTPAGAWTPEDHVSGAVNARLGLTPSTQLVTSLSVTHYRGFLQRTPLVLDLAISQELPFGQRATWRSRAMSYGVGGPTVPVVHQADYVVPFGMPVAPAAASGRVNARVTDDETGRPQSGVLVRMGDRIRLTDDSGRVSFDGLSPDTHLLELDRSALTPGRIVVPAAAVAVSVRAGETRDIALRLTRGARVHGMVQRLDRDTTQRLGAAAAFVDGGAVPGAVVQLADATDSLRVAVGADGRFAFDQVAPGQWVLTVLGADLPRYYRFEHERLAVTLLPGEERGVLFRAVPSAPAVEIVAQEELTLDGSFPGRKRGTAQRPDTAIAHVWTNSQRRTVTLAAPARREANDVLRDPHTPPWQVGVKRDVHTPHDTTVGVAPSSRAVPSSTHHYTVTKWDTSLAQLARVMYGDASLWPKIWLANLDQLQDPDALRAGQRLRIPGKAPLTAEEEAAARRHDEGHARLQW